MSVEDTIRQANDIARNAEVCYMSKLRQEYVEALRDRPTEAPLILQEIIEENDRLHAKHGKTSP
jgi:hypothetical protein